MDQESHVGVGLYSYPEAARIIGVKPRMLRRWVQEYYYTSRGRRYHHEPIVHRYFDDTPILTFHELVELLFVKIFRSHGVSMTTIRQASDRLARRYGVDYPFAVRRFDTDGHHIFETMNVEAGPKLIVEDVSRGQYAFDAIVRPFFRKLDYGDQAEVLALWPRERDGRIVIDPRRRFGVPIDDETGVPTAVLYEATLAGDGQSIEEVADWYEVPVEAVEAAVAYEQSPSVT